VGGGAGTAIHRRAPLLCSFSLLSLSLSLSLSLARSLACTFLAQGGSLGPAFLCVYVGWGEREKGANEMRSSGKKNSGYEKNGPVVKSLFPFPRRLAPARRISASELAQAVHRHSQRMRARHVGGASAGSASVLGGAPKKRLAHRRPTP